MNLKILDKTKKNKFIEGLSELGLEKVPEILIKTGNERVRAFSGNLVREELNEWFRILPVELVGLYVGKEIIDRHGVSEVRLSLDGLHLWKEQIKNNIIELDKEQEEKWFLGRDLEFGGAEFSGKFVAIKSKGSGDFIGTGKVSIDSKTLFNYLPKERRRKSNII